MGWFRKKKEKPVVEITAGVLEVVNQRNEYVEDCTMFGFKSMNEMQECMNRIVANGRALKYEFKWSSGTFSDKRNLQIGDFHLVLGRHGLADDKLFYIKLYEKSVSVHNELDTRSSLQKLDKILDRLKSFDINTWVSSFLLGCLDGTLAQVSLFNYKYNNVVHMEDGDIVLDYAIVKEHAYDTYFQLRFKFDLDTRELLNIELSRKNIFRDFNNVFASGTDEEVFKSLVGMLEDDKKESPF